MAARYNDAASSIMGTDREFFSSKFLWNTYNKVGMSLIVLFDSFVSSSTWDATYEMCIDQGMSVEEAKMKADQNVRLSQTDSLSLSRSKAMRSDWARMLTPFSTYLMGMQSVARGKAIEKDKSGFISWVLFYVVGVPFFESLLKEVNLFGSDDDDDKEYIERVIKRWYNDIITTGGNSALPLFNVGGNAMLALASGMERGFAPDEEDDERIFKYGTYGSGVAALNYVSQAYQVLYNVPQGTKEAEIKALINFVGLGSMNAKKILKSILEE